MSSSLRNKEDYKCRGFCLGLSAICRRSGELAAGHKVIWRPEHSPDFGPIELVFGYVQNFTTPLNSVTSEFASLAQLQRLFKSCDNKVSEKSNHTHDCTLWAPGQPLLQHRSSASNSASRFVLSQPDLSLEASSCPYCCPSAKIFWYST